MITYGLLGSPGVVSDVSGVLNLELDLETLGIAEDEVQEGIHLVFSK